MPSSACTMSHPELPSAMRRRSQQGWDTEISSAIGVKVRQQRRSGLVAVLTPGIPRPAPPSAMRRRSQHLWESGNSPAIGSEARQLQRPGHCWSRMSASCLQARSSHLRDTAEQGTCTLQTQIVSSPETQSGCCVAKACAYPALSSASLPASLALPLLIAALVSL